MSYIKQNDLLLKKLMYYYNKDDSLNKMLSIIMEHHESLCE